MFKLHRIPIRRLCTSPCRHRPDYGPVEVQRTELLNGIKVAAAKPDGAQIGSCTIMYQAGTRYECKPGVSHFIRNASTATSCSYTGYIKMRYLQQLGAAIHVTNDRQTLAYTLKCPVSVFPEIKYYFLDTAVRCEYNEWEIDDIRPIIYDDLERISPTQRVIDLAQRACWGGPLQNSLFCEHEVIDQLDGLAISQFCCANMKTDHCTVASLGIPYEETMKLAEKIGPNRKPEMRGLAFSYPRAGFEYLEMGPSEYTWICLVVPSAGTNHPDCMFKYAILAAACGSDDVQRGSHKFDRISETPLANLSCADPYSTFRAFNIAYVETGVFGILIKTRSCTAWEATMSANDFLNKIGTLSLCDIEIGRKRLKLNVALEYDNCTKHTEGLALQIANNLTFNTPCDMMNYIDCLPAEDVLAVAQCMSTKYMAVAAVGNIGCVPHDKLLRS